MKVRKDQIVNGIVSYVENEVIPHVGDKPTQIIASIAVKSIKSNQQLIDSIFESPIFKAFLVSDTDGYYEIEELYDAIVDTMKEYGPFPIVIPPIPMVSPAEKTLTFTEDDISEIKKRIERSM